MWLFLAVETIIEDIKNQKRLLQAVMVITFWDFLMLFWVLLSPQVKGSVITTELSHQLLNDLGHRILGRNISKMSKLGQFGQMFECSFTN